MADEPNATESVAETWESRLPKLEPRYSTPESRVYEIGRWNIHVHQDGTVREEDRHKRWDRSGDPRRAFPNMEVVDGELRLPVSDLVGEVLRRIDPVELAQALWSNEDVRIAFVAEMGAMYSSQSHVTDMERRQWLHDVQAAVHSRALDRATDRLAAAEYEHARYFDRYNFTSTVNAWLRDNGIDKRFAHEPEPPDFRIGGKAWNEARDDWRRLVLERFPPPEPLGWVVPEGGITDEIKAAMLESKGSITLLEPRAGDDLVPADLPEALRAAIAQAHTFASWWATQNLHNPVTPEGEQTRASVERNLQMLGRWLDGKPEPEAAPRPDVPGFDPAVDMPEDRAAGAWGDFAAQVDRGPAGKGGDA